MMLLFLYPFWRGVNIKQLKKICRIKNLSEKKDLNNSTAGNYPTNYAHASLSTQSQLIPASQQEKKRAEGPIRQCGDSFLVLNMIKCSTRDAYPT